MQEAIKLIIGIVVLALGIPVGKILAHYTKEELKDGHKWFILIIFISLIGGIASLIFRNDAFMFSFFFIAIVTSGSLIKRNRKSIPKIKNELKKGLDKITETPIEFS